MSETDVIRRVLRIARDEATKSAAGVAGTLKTDHSNNVKYNTAYYGHEVSDPHGDVHLWCVVFIWWVMRQAEVPATVFPKVASVFKQPNANVRDFFKARNRFMSASSMPKEGDLVIFKKSHIGIVESVDSHSNTISTVEGNASDRVRRRSYRRTNSDIDGYCRPAYDMVEEDDFMALFDNVNEFKAAVRAVVKDEVDKAVQGELKDFFVLLARGGDPVPGPDDQHFKDSHRGLDTRLDDIYRLLARGSSTARSTRPARTSETPTAPGQAPGGDRRPAARIDPAPLGPRALACGRSRREAFMPRFGPDISHHQKTVNLTRAKPHVDFVFLKATDGIVIDGAMFVDQTFKPRWQQLAELGIPRGAYHYARPNSSPATQAAHFISVVRQNEFRSGDAT